MDFTPLALLFAASALATFAGTGALLPFLRARAILDHPNDRSSHQSPTPKGGGIVVVTVVLTGWIGVAMYLEGGAFLTWIIPGAAAALAVLSWVDDLRDLPPITRLLAQIAAVTVVLTLKPGADLFFQGLLPPVLDAFVAGVFWVWFINLFNFMDGIDGITCTEALIIGLGLGLIGNGLTGLLGLIIAGSALGFLKWNWYPAKIFLGDVGSVPLGFVLGWLLLDMADDGQWAAALILPAYYLADATTTLIRRAVRGEIIWHAHRQHFYQQAVQRGLSHGMVSLCVLGVGLFLIGLAWQSEQGRGLPALALTVVLSCGHLVFLAGGKRS